MMFKKTTLERDNIENGTNGYVFSALKENNVDFPWKKSVTWSSKLEEVREYEKPGGKSYYGRLSDKIGKPRRVLINTV
jgi:hypothetical protein